jgi:hypothetical protein
MQQVGGYNAAGGRQERLTRMQSDVVHNPLLGRCPMGFLNESLGAVPCSNTAAERSDAAAFDQSRGGAVARWGV